MLTQLRIRLGAFRRDAFHRSLDWIAFCLCGGRVAGGPFRGLRYLSAASCGALPPRLTGSYESELAPVMREALRTPFDRVVDVGAAEGYYAVGFASRGRAARIVAFEIESATREKLKQLAAYNGVTAKLDLRAGADAASLQDALSGSAFAFVLVDVEGYERTLLDPAAVPALAHAHLVVETHVFVHADLVEVLHARFRDTHDCFLIPQKPEHIRPSLKSMHWLARFRSFRKESRPENGTPWLVLVPKNSTLFHDALGETTARQL